MFARHPVIDVDGVVGKGDASERPGKMRQLATARTKRSLCQTAYHSADNSLGNAIAAFPNACIESAEKES
ncbi:MAG: hypothetical protein R2875_03880 [Desulfobacterales bacterium]